jgi:hypothetical protein
LSGYRASGRRGNDARRWFIAKARDAINAGVQGFTIYTVAEVVGHTRRES